MDVIDRHGNHLQRLVSETLAKLGKTPIYGIDYWFSKADGSRSDEIVPDHIIVDRSAETA